MTLTISSRFDEDELGDQIARDEVYERRSHRERREHGQEQDTASGRVRASILGLTFFPSQPAFPATLNGDDLERLANAEIGKIRPDRVCDVVRREMGVVLFRHAGVGVAELLGDDGHRNASHCKL